MHKIFIKYSLVILSLLSFSSLFWYLDFSNLNLILQILELRLPRYLASLIVGASLAICGCLVQNITHNPLAEPSILGISSSSSLISILFLIYNLNPVFGGIIGAIIGLFILNFNFQTKHFNIFENFSLHILLKGLMLTTITGAGITLCLQLSSEKLPQLLFWLMGDFNYINFSNLNYLILSLVGLILYIFKFKTKLNYLWLDNIKAYTLGVNLNTLHKATFLIIGISVGIITSQVGNIAFIGLICPYLARYILNIFNLNTNVINSIIYSGLIGAIILKLSDTIAKFILYPAQISIGVITAFIGVPLFWKILYAIHKKS